jgi:signal peptidase I
MPIYKGKIILIIGSVFIIIGIGYLTMLKSPVRQPFHENQGIFNGQCPIKIEERIVRGRSLQGLIEDGQIIKALFGYYNCHKIVRGDVVLYDFAGNKEPVIKIVKGIEGDSFHLMKVDGGYHILINGEIIKNAQGEPYLIDHSGYKMLSLYEKDYRGIIPKDAYLIMGNITSGATDSSRFGFVGVRDILGKAEY